MTLHLELTCDGYQCLNTRFPASLEQSDLERGGWHTDPACEDFHYCPQCWEEIQSEKDD